MLNVTKKLKLFVIYTELLSTIWLRLLIAVIALTISSDLSAWAQPQMQVNSPEGFYDCKSIANGRNTRDGRDKCCLPETRVCDKCDYKKNQCEEVFACDEPAPVCNKCRYTMTPCETQLNQCGATPNVGCGCGNPAPNACDSCTGDRSCYGCDGVAKSGKTFVCGTCGGTMGGCGRCSGCMDCKTFRCSYTKGSYWPMFHNTGTNCGSAFELPNNEGGPVNLGHGTTFYRVTLFSQPPRNEEKKCYPEGRLDPATCADTNKSGWIYSTNIAGERVSIEEERGKKSCTCNDGTITCN